MAQVQTSSASGEDSPKLTLSPTSAQPNQYVAVTGENFTTGGSATLASLTIGSIAVPAEKINFGSPVKVDTGGRFVTNVVVPLNSATLKGGSLTVIATDSSGKGASETLTITEPSISVSPASGRVDSTVKVTGSGFPLDSLNPGTDEAPQVAIRYYVTTTTYEQVATAHPDSAGAFTIEFKVPSNAAIPSTENKVEAAIVGTSAAVTTQHSVNAPQITVSPASGVAGDAVTVTGSDFKSFFQLISLSIGNVQMEIPSNITTDSSGKFTVTASVPPTDTGAQPILAQVGPSIYTTIFTVNESGTAATTTTEPILYRTSLKPGTTPDNLLRIFHFNNADKKWSFFDPQPEYAEFINLTELVPGKAYWIKARRTQTTVVGGSVRYFVEGWNLVAW